MVEGQVNGAGEESATVSAKATGTCRRKTAYFLVTLLYVALAVALTWPLAARIGTGIPRGREASETVPLLNAWTIWWNADRLEHAYRGYWDAPIFYPARRAFVLGEPQPVTGWLSYPLLKIFGLPATYNIFLVGSLLLNAWFGTRLLRQLQVSHWGQVLGGSWLMALPLVHAGLGVLQVVPLWGVFWTLTSAWKLAKTQGLWSAFELALSLAVTYGMNCHYGLFLLTVLPFWLAAGIKRRSMVLRILGLFGLSLGLFALLAAPIVIPQLTRLHARGTRRDIASVQALSATPASYVRSHSYRHASAHPARRLGIGVFKSLLALASLWIFRRAASVRALWITAAAAAVLSMSASISWPGSSLYELLSTIVPGFGSIRSIYRYAFLVQLGGIALSVFALDAILGAHPNDSGDDSLAAPKRAALSWWAVVVWSVVLVTGLVETWPASPQISPAPPLDTDWAEWLREFSHPDAVIAVVPLGTGNSPADFRLSALAMYLQPVHERRLVNGYNGYFPASHRALAPALCRLPDAASLGTFERTGVTHIVAYGRCDRELMQTRGWRRVANVGQDSVELWTRVETVRHDVE